MINVFFRLLYYFLIARIILSYFAFNPYGKPWLVQLKKVVYQVTEPILLPFRNIIPLINMGGGYIDLSPIVAIIVLNFIRGLLINLVR
ncbi:YggT family protein [Candidatus Contubernalis alkalaceticus]|uniref:YggT family protein n=1 Tax=Candidatus Contubernalis alkaliaceticus TaxID=338645 RepID=UPI00387E85AC